MYIKLTKVHDRYPFKDNMISTDLTKIQPKRQTCNLS